MALLNDEFNWADMAERAFGLIANVDNGNGLGDGSGQAPEWVEAARRYRDDFTQAVAIRPPGHADLAGRWRPIDSRGNVDPKPAPEPPDDPDENESGPPEVGLP